MTMINSTLFQIPIINSVIEYACTDSTNLKAKEVAKRGSVHGTLVIAHKQTAGKGRMGRSFDSPRDEGIYMSLLLRPKLDLSHLANITLITAIALVRTLQHKYNIAPLIKWPNDIVLNGKKLVGILTESGPDYVVIGIGVNVNNSVFPSDIKDSATSIKLETGADVDIFELIESILINFNTLYNQFISAPDIGFLVDEYNSRLASYNKDIYIIPHNISSTQDNPYVMDTSNLEPFFCKGIDANGNLICQNALGNIITVNSGEVSLRGTNGYI